ncbi:hypothetical protein CR513_13902, partial [Mucuna pruriens]
MSTLQSILVELTPQADSASESYSDANFKADADFIANIDSYPNADFKPDADSRCRFPFVRVHPSTKDQFHSGNSKHDRDPEPSKYRDKASSKCPTPEPTCGEDKSEEPEHKENLDRTLKELATLDVLELAWSYELKSGLIHLLPEFHGLAGEDPHKHLMEFHVICSMMRPKGLAIPIASSFSHLGRYEAHVSGEVLPDVQNYDHLEGDIWDQVILERNPA